MQVVTALTIADALALMLNAAQELGYEVQICEVPEDGSDYLYVNGGTGGVGHSIEHDGRHWKVM